ncbi:MAG TPA: sulfatase-like hydrolase/transferase [Opitutaceae bacterium]|nr:sulfatase-like hydrolase/transferase [Opitutaceae bacterium]
MAAKPPNILWIVTTQWRAQAAGYAGDPNARTPCLDALAAQSVNFTQAVTPHPFGPFARAALLTGVPSPENGVCDYFDPLPVNARTVAHALRERGYATAFFGKWHLTRRDRNAPLVGEAHARTIVPPDSRGGFEFWEGFESGFLLNDPWLHGTALPEPVRFRGYQPAVLAERAERWWVAGGKDARPWFCVVSLETPHPPYDAEAPGGEPMRVEEIRLAPNVPPGGEIEAKARRELAGYYRHIAATDQSIAQLLGNLGCERDRERTIVVFTSVHGDMHGAHGLFRKGWPHEESVRVPLLVRHREAPPMWSDSLVSLLDLTSWTINWADGAKLQTPASRIQRISMPSVVAIPHQCGRVWRGVRSATRKLILNADGTPWLFFDLGRDPHEQENLASDPTRRDEIAEWRERF